MSQPQTVGSLLDRIPAEQRECEQHGTYLARMFRSEWSRCPACREIEKTSREAEQAIVRERERIEAWVSEAGIPQRFRSATLDGYKVQCEGQQRAKDFAMELASALAEKAAGGRSAIFIGLPGTGKTHLACAIARATIEAGRFAMFTTTVRMMRRIKATWSRDSEETETHAIEAFTLPPLLVLDEVGVQFGSETEKMMLFDVLNERYEERRSTILLSNLALDGVKGFLGERVFDRIREDGGQYIAFDWESFRGKAA